MPPALRSPVASMPRRRVLGDAAAADVDQRADDDADHVLEEGGRFDVEGHHAAPAGRRPGGARSGSSCVRSQSEARNARKSCSPTSAAAARRTASVSSGLAHVPRGARQPRRAHEVVPDRVAVDLAARREARVELGRRLGRRRRSRGRAAGSCSARAAGRAAGWSSSRSKLATWPSACTPASVRPAPRTNTVSPVMSRIASSSVAWTVRCPICRCQPEKSVPSYSTTMRHLPPAQNWNMSPSDQLVSPTCSRFDIPSPEMSACVNWNTSDVWLTPMSASNVRAASGSKKSSTNADPDRRVPAPGAAAAFAALAVGGDLVVAVGDLPVRPVEPDLAVRARAGNRRAPGSSRSGRSPTALSGMIFSVDWSLLGAPLPLRDAGRCAERREIAEAQRRPRPCRSGGRSRSRTRSASSAARRPEEVPVGRARAVELAVDVRQVGAETQLERETLGRLEAVGASTASSLRRVRGSCGSVCARRPRRARRRRPPASSATSVRVPSPPPPAAAR